ELLAALTGDLEDVPEAPRGDEGGAGVPALDDGVRDDRGPVRDRGSGRRERLETREDSACRGIRCREDLERSDDAGRGIEGDEVGEGPANVDPDAHAHRAGPLPSVWPVAALDTPDETYHGPLGPPDTHTYLRWP